MFNIVDLKTLTIVSLVALTALAAGEALGTLATTTQIVPQRSPKLRVEPTRIPLLRERKPVFDIPHRIVNFATPASWSAPATDRSGPPSALAIQRSRAMGTAPCTTFYDYVDLTAPRRNGFRLVGYDIQALPPPSGYSLQSPAEALAIDTSARDTPTTDLPSAGQIQIRPPLYVRTVPPMNGCASGYSLTTTLEGPRGRDPFAGVRSYGGGGWRDRR